MAAPHLFSPTPVHTPDVSFTWDEDLVYPSPEAVPQRSGDGHNGRSLSAPDYESPRPRPRPQQQPHQQQAWRAPPAAVRWANEITQRGQWMVQARRDAIRRGAGSFGFLPNRFPRGRASTVTSNAQARSSSRAASERSRAPQLSPMSGSQPAAATSGSASPVPAERARRAPFAAPAAERSLGLRHQLQHSSGRPQPVAVAPRVQPLAATPAQPDHRQRPSSQGTR